MSRVEMRDPNKVYHPMKLSDLEQLTPGFDWPVYLRAVRAPSFTMVNVQQPLYMKDDGAGPCHCAAIGDQELLAHSRHRSDGTLPVRIP